MAKPLTKAKVAKKIKFVDIWSIVIGALVIALFSDEPLAISLGICPIAIGLFGLIQQKFSLMRSLFLLIIYFTQTIFLLVMVIQLILEIVINGSGLAFLTLALPAAYIMAPTAILFDWSSSPEIMLAMFMVITGILAIICFTVLIVPICKLLKIIKARKIFKPSEDLRNIS
jgi:hypothetical protein